MTRHTPETVCNETPNDITAHPILTDRDFRRLAPALELSTDNWLRVLQAHNGLPSTRRDFFRETISLQLEGLSWNVEDDDPCPESLELARHLAALPHMLKLTVLETIERFWASDAGDFSLEDRLRDMGLRPCTSAHERMAAFRYRQHVLAEENGPADPAT